MDKQYEDYVQAIHQLFEKRFAEAYKQSNPKRRARLLPFIATVYRRFLYASLLEETLLTPMFIIESAGRHFDRPLGSAPVVRAHSERKYAGTSVTIRPYYATSHPVVGDLRVAIEFCRDTIDLCEDDSPNMEQCIQLAAGLSLSDPHYASYLIGIALWMNLLTKIPSIYANRAQLSRDCAKRLSASDTALFKEIVDATVTYAAFNLNDLMPQPEPVFGESFIRAILKKPMSTDEIFQRVYDLLGVSIEDMMDENGENEFDEMDAAFLSSTYMMGIAMDKYFFTPFGYYLKLIHPFYAMPFDFDTEIVLYLNLGFAEDELGTAFFAPCSLYYLTDLGLKYFKVKPNAENYVDVRTQLPFPKLMEGLFEQPGALDVLPVRIQNPDLPAGRVYELKVKDAFDAALWLVLEMPAETVLHRLYQEVAVCFGLNPGGDYSFYHDETENPFAEYVSPKRARRAKRAAETALEHLDFEHRRQLILTTRDLYDPFAADRGKPSKYLITRTDTRPRRISVAYPIVTRVSKKLRAFFEMEE